MHEGLVASRQQLECEVDAQEAEDGELEDKQEKTEDRTQRIRSSDTGASSDANEESEEESGYEASDSAEEPTRCTDTEAPPLSHEAEAVDEVAIEGEYEVGAEAASVAAAVACREAGVEASRIWACV